MPQLLGVQRDTWTQDPEIQTWAEMKSLIFNRLRYPGTLGFLFKETEMYINDEGFTVSVTEI